ncbi:hypothetical protein C8R43DRAFT_975844 [Mycena crocata]|nr:hypothetical protein C8R43DRAFT_975844 [Mycena crocata]
MGDPRVIRVGAKHVPLKGSFAHQVSDRLPSSRISQIMWSRRASDRSMAVAIIQIMVVLHPTFIVLCAPRLFKQSAQSQDGGTENFGRTCAHRCPECNAGIYAQADARTRLVIESSNISRPTLGLPAQILRLVAIGIFVIAEILVLYAGFGYSYRRGLDNIPVLLIGGISIAMPSVLSVTLAVGAQQLAKHKAIVTPSPPLRSWLVSRSCAPTE